MLSSHQPVLKGTSYGSGLNLDVELGEEIAGAHARVVNADLHAAGDLFACNGLDDGGGRARVARGMRAQWRA